MSATSSNANVPYKAVPHQVLVLASTEKKWASLAFFGVIFMIVLLGVPAAMLSWKCNKALGYSTFSNLFYSIGAFMTGLYYIMYYVFYRADMCKHCKAKTI